MSTISCTGPLVLLGLICATGSAKAQAGTATWMISMTAKQNPLPIGQCTAIELMVVDGVTRQPPVRPDGKQVDWQDFDLSLTAQPPGAFDWSDPQHHRFICARGLTSSTALVVASYPAQHLTPNERVTGVAQATVEISPATGQAVAAAPGANGYGAARPQPDPNQPNYQPQYGQQGAAPTGQQGYGQGTYPAAPATAGAPGQYSQPPGYPQGGNPQPTAYPQQQGGYPNQAGQAGAAPGAPTANGQPPQQTYYPNQPGQPGAAPGSPAAGGQAPQQAYYPNQPAQPGAAPGSPGTGQPPQQAGYANSAAPAGVVPVAATAPVPAEPKKKGGFFGRLGQHLKDKANEVKNQTTENLTSSATQVVDATAQTGSNLVSGTTAKVSAAAQSKVGSVTSSLVPSSLRLSGGSDNLELAVKSGQAVLPMIHFGDNNAVPDAQSLIFINHLADVLNRNPNSPAGYLIRAYVDPAQAGADQGQKLSEERAGAVKAALAGNHFQGTLKAVGYGVGQATPDVPSARIEIWKLQ